MIDSQFILAFSLYSISMLATPGPNNATMMAVGVSHGYKATLPHLFACTLFGGIMMVFTGAGLGKVFESFPFLYKTLQWVGTIYLIWLAGRIAGIDVVAHVKNIFFYRKQKDKKIPISTNKGTMKPMTFVQASLFQLTNIKAWMSCLVAVSTYAGADEGMWTRLWVMTALYTILCLPSGFIWGLGGDFMGKFLHSEGMRRANYIFASFILLSIVLLYV